MYNFKYIETRDYLNRKIICKNTTDIFKSHNVPQIVDLISIDVEGYEEKAIRGIDFNEYSFIIMIIETDKINSNYIKSLLPEEYKLVKTDDINSLFVNQKFKNEFK